MSDVLAAVSLAGGFGYPHPHKRVIVASLPVQEMYGSQRFAAFTWEDSPAGVDVFPAAARASHWVLSMANVGRDASGTECHCRGPGRLGGHGVCEDQPEG